MPGAHPDDILVVANLREARQYPEFAQRAVFTCSMPMRVTGRRFRTAWITPQALESRNWPEMAKELNRSATLSGGEVKSSLHWVPEEPTLVDLIKALPADNASPSRDFGRGYSKAIGDVLALIALDQL